MLTFLLITAMFGQGQSLVGYGFEFITAFPENVANFCPFYAWSSLNFTALYNDTEINVYYKGFLEYTTILHKGETENYILPGEVEETKFNQSLKSIRIISSKYIVALSITEQGHSKQTNVLLPYENLGMYYSIPSLNYSEMLTLFYQTSDIVSKRYEFFRLVIINAESVANTVTIRYKSLPNAIHVLQPRALLQLQLNGSEIAVDAYYKVAVLVSHPCIEATKCECNMVLNQLRPDTQWGNSFVVPLLNNMTYLHVTENSLLTQPVAANLKLVKSTQYVQTNSPTSLRLISPGLIIEVIPDSLFSACYLVHFSVTNGNVLVIAETGSKSQVHIDSNLLSSQNWATIGGTNYSSVSVSLNGRHVIWHPTSKIGVYMFRKMASGTQYGGPAVPLSDQPDPAGCLFSPMEYSIVPALMTWPESYQYCLSINRELADPTTAKEQGIELTDILEHTTTREHWIGLRRNLLTLEWYWYKNDSLVEVNSTQWNIGEPSDTQLGLCASMLPNMMWKSVPCCTPLKPICFKQSDYFSNVIKK